MIAEDEDLPPWQPLEPGKALPRSHVAQADDEVIRGNRGPPPLAEHVVHLDHRAERPTEERQCFDGAEVEIGPQQIYEAQLAEALERRDEKGFDVAGFRLLLSMSRARGAIELKHEDGLV